MAIEQTGNCGNEKDCMCSGPVSHSVLFASIPLVGGHRTNTRVFMVLPERKTREHASQLDQGVENLDRRGLGNPAKKGKRQRDDREITQLARIIGGSNGQREGKRLRIMEWLPWFRRLFSLPPRCPDETTPSQETTHPGQVKGIIASSLQATTVHNPNRHSRLTQGPKCAGCHRGRPGRP